MNNGQDRLAATFIKYNNYVFVGAAVYPNIFGILSFGSANMILLSTGSANRIYYSRGQRLYQAGGGSSVFPHLLPSKRNLRRPAQRLTFKTITFPVESLWWIIRKLYSGVTLNLHNKCLCCRKINENKIVFHSSWSNSATASCSSLGIKNSQH